MASPKFSNGWVKSRALSHLCDFVLDISLMDVDVNDSFHLSIGADIFNIQPCYKIQLYTIQKNTIFSSF